MPAEQNIIAFSYLLKNQPSLFLPYQTSLLKLNESLPNNVEKISETIIIWCKAHSVYDEMLEVLNNDKPLEFFAKDKLHTYRAILGKRNMNVEQCKDLIDNSIRTSIASTAQLSKQDNDKNQPSSGNPQS